MESRPKIKLGPAIWKQESQDIPVEVFAVWGYHGSSIWYGVRGATDAFRGVTGVPEDELYQSESDEEEDV